MFKGASCDKNGGEKSAPVELPSLFLSHLFRGPFFFEIIVFLVEG